MKNYVSVTMQSCYKLTYTGPLDFVFIVCNRDFRDILPVYPHLMDITDEHAFATLSKHPVHVSCQMDAAINHSIIHGQLIGIPSSSCQYRTQLRIVRHALTLMLKYCQKRHVSYIRSLCFASVDDPVR